MSPYLSVARPALLLLVLLPLATAMPAAAAALRLPAATKQKLPTAAAAATSGIPAPEVLVWFPLHRFNESAVAAQLALMARHPGAVSVVSYTRWSIAANGSIYEKHPNDIVHLVHAVPVAAGAPRLKAVPMLGCGDIKSMQKLLHGRRRQAVIRQFAAVVHKNGYDGVNVDFEGNKDGPVQDSDAGALTSFVIDLQKELLRIGSHAAVSVDVNDPTWGKWWRRVPEMATDLAALPMPSGGPSRMTRLVTTMSTYQKHYGRFAESVNAAASYLPASVGNIGIGKLPKPGTPGYDNPKFISTKLALLQSSAYASKFRGVGIWCLPLPPSWWPVLQRYRRGDPVV